MDGNNHYIRVDANNIVTYAFSDAFEQPQMGDICIERNTSRQFNLQIIDQYGQFLYQYINGELILQSSFILSSTPVSATPNTYIITVTSNNIPATPLTNVTFIVASTPIIQSYSNNQATLTVQLHKVVAGLKNTIVVSANGFVNGTINIGGTGTSSNNVKAVTQSDGSVLIKNTSKQEITNYYMMHTVSQSDIETDLANMIDFYGDMLNKLMLWSQNASYAPINLTANEKNAITQFGSGYIPNIRLKLEDASPLGSTPQNPRYPNIVNHKQQANTSADEYLQVISDPDVK